MANNNDNSIIDGFFDDLVGNFVNISNLMPRLKNIDYDSQTNTTTVYGHTNFEELKVNNTNVALENHNHDSSYSALNHTHDIDDIIQTYEEEEDFVEEEEENGEGNNINVNKTRTITKTKTLTTILDSKADIDHNHDTEYATINHNHDTEYATIDHNHDTEYATINHTHNYANSSHTHSISDVTELPATLTNLSSTLNSKADSSHNHSINDINDLVKTESDLDLPATITNISITKSTNTIDIIVNIEPRANKNIRFANFENEQMIVQWIYKDINVPSGTLSPTYTESIYYSSTNGVYI